MKHLRTGISARRRGAVFLRMALLTCMVDRADRVMDVDLNQAYVRHRRCVQR